MHLLYLIFFLSGVAALVYQIVWIRLFGLVFGATTLSMSVVVAAFMGGLALGSRYFGKYADRVSNQVRLYGYLELILGASGIVVYYSISAISRFLYSLPFEDIHADTSTGILLRLGLSLAVLLVPTFLMGGTLPVLIKAVTRSRKEIIAKTSYLYSVNTFGAMAGAFLVGFIFIRFFGVTWSNHIAVTINLALGSVALAVSPRFQRQEAGNAKKDLPEINSLHRGMRFLVALGITGFVSLTLEMIWVRLLLLVTNPTTYLYSIILTTYLAGLALGGLLLPRIVPQSLRNERTFGLLLGGVGLTVMLGFAAYPVTSYLAYYTTPAFFITWTRMSLLTGILFILMGFVPVILMGMTLPLGVGLYAGEMKSLSNRVGFIYAVNTVGSLLGSLLSVFVIVPAIGLTGTIILCVLSLIVLSFYFISRSERGTNNVPAYATISIIGGVLVLVGLQLDIPRSILGRHMKSGEYIEYLHEGSASTIWITNRVNGSRKIWMDNLWISSTSDEGTHALLSHYPVQFHDNPKTICGIAFGTGQTFGTCLLYPIDLIKSVEIDPDIIEACRGRFDKENFGILNDSRNEVIIDDGRFFLEGTSETFDIITAEPLQPYTRGTVNLYSYDFYEACRKRLKPGGICAQWLPLYNTGVSDSWSLVRTFATAFDHVVLFLNGNDGILLGSDREITIDPSKPLPERVVNDMMRIENGSSYDLLGNFIAHRNRLLEASSAYPVITDDHPTLEFTAPITHWNEDRAGMLEMRRQLVELMEPVDPLVKGGGDVERARLFQQSRRLLNLAYIAEKSGRLDESIQLYKKAHDLNRADVLVMKELVLLLRKTDRIQDLPDDMKELIQRAMSRQKQQ